MNELVFNNHKGESITTSLIVAEVFGKEHKNVLRDIENLSCSKEFRSLNFEHTPYEHPQNHQIYHCFQMTKDGFSFLVMGYTGERAGEFKEKFINEFNKREALLKNDDYIMVRAFEIQQNRIKSLEAQARLLEACNVENVRQIEEMKPKALFADCVTASTQSILIGELAKILKQNGIEIGQNRLFQWLRDKGYLLSKGEYYNRPSQRAMELQLFEIEEWTGKRPNGDSITNVTVKVTGKGQLYFVNKFLPNQRKSA